MEGHLSERVLSFGRTLVKGSERTGAFVGEVDPLEEPE